MRLLRIIFFLSSILTFSVVAVVGVIYYLLSNSIPPYNQQLKSAEISQSTSIIRDTYAVPYIKSLNDEDSFFALGYTHAQDRLWQMILLRRIAQGRLSEILGSKALEGDTLMRTISIYEKAQESEKYQTKHMSKLLNSYSAGINTYINQISEMGLGRGGPEFFLFTSEISPWRPADSIAIIKLIGFLSSNNARLEILRTQLMLAKISSERLNDIFEEPPFINDPKSQIISYLIKSDKDINKVIVNKDSQKKLFSSWIQPPIASSLGASNIFAVMPSRSGTGSSLAASDPHSAFTAPSNFMLVSIDLSSGNVIGGTIPGIPAILIGRNKNIGWGISNAKIDDQDLFIEKLNPENPLQYFTDKGMADFDIEHEIIKIKNERSVTIEIKNTKNGPILPLKALGSQTIRPKGHEISMSWTGLSSTDRSIEALISIMFAKSIAEAEKNLPLLEAPGQNVMLVDKENISIVTAGAIPARKVNHSTRGTMPSLAWIDKNSWIGRLSFDKHPKIYNPKSGIVINTNNKTTNANFPNHISYDWGDSQRIIRANNLLKKRQFHTVSSFKEIQTDTVSVSARILLPLLARNLWFNPGTNKEFDFNTSEEKVIELLSEWNGDMNQNSSEPLIYVTWINEFQKMVMRDELGSLYNNMKNIRPLFLERVLRDKNGASKWCDIAQTSLTETCEQIAKSALRVAVKTLEEKFGLDINEWRWGEAHIAIHKPQIIGSWPALSFFTNIVHEISGGDNTLMMSRMVNSSKNQNTASHGSTLRAIFDFSSNNVSLFILSTGQSGHFLSKHYDDQSILWQQEQYITMRNNEIFYEGIAPITIFSPDRKLN